MAATQQGKIHLSLMDDVGVRASVEFFLMIDPTKTVAQLITDVNTFGLTVLPLVDGGWVRWEIGILPVLPTGALSTPTVDSDAEEVGGFTYPQTGSSYLYTIALPTLVDGVISGSKIDQSNPNVTAFETACITAGTNGTEIVSREFRVLTAVRQTFLGIRKHRRSLHSKSLDVVNP